MRLQARAVRRPVEARRRAALCFAACQREIAGKSIQLQQSLPVIQPRRSSDVAAAIAGSKNYFKYH
jgi:hypothetical protein